MLFRSKKTENALRESEERLQQIDSSSRDAIYSYNRQSRFTHANKALCALLGLNRDEIIGKTQAFQRIPNFRIVNNIFFIVHGLLPPIQRLF